MLNRSGESEDPCLFPNLGESTFSFLLLSMMLAVSLICIVCVMMQHAPSLSTLWRVFVINGWWIFQKIFCLYWDDLMIFIPLLMWCVMLVHLQILNHPCILRINTTWSWFIIFLMYCWIWFANIFLSIFALCILVILAYNFFFFLVWFWYQTKAGLLGGAETFFF